MGCTFQTLRDDLNLDEMVLLQSRWSLFENYIKWFESLTMKLKILYD